MQKLTKAWLKLRVGWSNTKNAKNLVNCDVEEAIKTPTALKNLSKQLYKNFKYTYDGIDELGDSMRFPALCYKELKSGCLKDDCDGYHAAMYHIAKANGFECYLLTYITKNLKDSHTVLVLRYNNSWYKLDYDCLSQKKATVKELITKDIYCYNLVQFNYAKHKWFICNGVK